MSTETKEVKTKPTEVDNFVWNIPECCKEGWDSCIHVVNCDLTRIKTNIGM